MASDGVSDALALAQADLGLAIGTGTDVAIEASELTLVSADLLAGADALRLTRTTLGTIKQNLVWAFGYNAAALPLAASRLLNPVIAGAPVRHHHFSRPPTGSSVEHCGPCGGDLPRLRPEPTRSRVIRASRHTVSERRTGGSDATSTA